MTTMTDTTTRNHADTCAICAHPRVAHVSPDECGWCYRCDGYVARGAPEPAGADVAAQLHAATATRAAVPGYPEAGPYPATVGEVADEVLAWTKAREDDLSARGLTGAIASRLLTAADPDLPVAFDEDGNGRPLWIGEGWEVRPLEDGEVEVHVADDSHPGNSGPTYVFGPEIVAAIAAAHRLGDQTTPAPTQ